MAEYLEVGEVPQLWKDLTHGKQVVGEVEHFQGGEVAQRGRYSAFKKVIDKGEYLECSLGEENGAREVAARDVEIAEVGEEEEGVREGTGEELLGKVKVFEIVRTGDIVESEGLINGIIWQDYGR